jgi:hypothetical protein
MPLSLVLFNINQQGTLLATLLKLWTEYFILSPNPIVSCQHAEKSA